MVDLNVPYGFLDFDALTLYVSTFFQIGSENAYSDLSFSQQPIPGDPGHFYLDIQLTASDTGNNNNYDGVMISIAGFTNCEFALVTLTNSDGTRIKTKIHIEAPTLPDE